MISGQFANEGLRGSPRLIKRDRRIPTLLRQVDYSTTPPYPEPRPRNAARKAGLRFQRRVEKELSRRFPENEVRCGLWLTYHDRFGIGAAQVDAVVELEEAIVVVEAKLTHVLDAEIQLREVYLPLLRWLHPSRPFVLVEACKNWCKNLRPVVFAEPEEFTRYASIACPPLVVWHFP